MFFKSKQSIMAALMLIAVVAAPAWASLPYYNQDLGYTIWLGEGWVESPASLTRYTGYDDGLSAMNSGWETVYTQSGSRDVSLLVSRLQGKIVSPSAIARFNRHVVRQLKQLSNSSQEWNGKPDVKLRKANYDSEKNTLRLEMDAVGPSGDNVTSVVYIVYTRNTMLKFVGLARTGDHKGVNAIDAAVSTLYLDRGLSN